MSGNGTAERVECCVCGKAMTEAQVYARLDGRAYCGKTCYGEEFERCNRCGQWTISARANRETYGARLCDPCFVIVYGVTMQGLVEGGPLVGLRHLPTNSPYRSVWEIRTLGATFTGRIVEVRGNVWTLEFVHAIEKDPPIRVRIIAGCGEFKRVRFLKKEEL